MSIYDVDASYNNLQVTLTVANKAGEPLLAAGVLNLTNFDSHFCFFAAYSVCYCLWNSNLINFFLKQINCTTTLQKLNLILTQIVFSGPDAGAGKFSLIVFVDDLGDGANANARPTSHLTASASLNVTCMFSRAPAHFGEKGDHL